MITQETIATTPNLPNDNTHSIAVLNQVSTMGKIEITIVTTATTIIIRIRFANIFFSLFFNKINHKFTCVWATNAFG